MREIATCVAWNFTFGFVRPAGATDRLLDCFVHYSALPAGEGWRGWRALEVGYRVEFRRTVDEIGRQGATDVVLLNRKVA